MQACSSCGAENAETAKFCSECGTPLATVSPTAREERKVVTVVFADLVGSTARAELLDPEDVRAILAPYHERLRHELERYGGTVEKFIGDAVVGVFGAPVAHEDDAERAVRAALAIQDGIAELNEADPALELEVRIGVHTGEALVSVNARPEAGEAMVAGDVMNTGARLQAAAPPGGVLVSDVTYGLTERAIEYSEVESVLAKGKAAELTVWLAQAPRGRVGVDVPGSGRAPLVGRSRELDALTDALARAREELEPQLVTLVGVPGIGKSRLVYELWRVVDADPDLITWRQGRSLPYGEGVAFWALGEMVKAQAGILETDDSEEAGAKLRRMVADLVVDEGEATWIERHARPLVGLVPEEGGAADQRDEAAAAWRRLVEALVDWRPAVLVFEDLHWADDGLLDFVDELVDWLREAPLLIVATARPELLERRPSWGGGKRNAATLSLPPLSDADTARLISSLLERSVLPAETQASLLTAAGGNPLYAEEFARMRESREGEATEVPRTLQAIVAARIDSLALNEKSVLQAASVLGKVFWTSALAALGASDSGPLDDVLRSLERKEFVRRERRSTVEAEQQYAFLHGLIRDVAYGQLPRSDRVEKHRLAAEWIEALGRAEDHAELVAHHYGAALELARAAGIETSVLEERTRRASIGAGDRAMRLLALPAASRFYATALELWPTDDPERARILLARGRASVLVRGEELADDALIEAHDLLLAASDVEAAAEASWLLSQAASLRGDRGAANDHLEHAASLLDDQPPSRTKAEVLMRFAGRHMVNDDFEEAVRRGEEAAAIAEEVGAHDARAGVLLNIGSARAALGEWEAGLADLEHGLALAREHRSWQMIRGFGMLRDTTFELGDLSGSAQLLQQGLEAAQRHGMGSTWRWLRGEHAVELYHAGSWDESCALVDDVVGDADAPWWFDPETLRVRALIRLGRGDLEGAQADVGVALERARDGRDPQILYPPIVVSALVAVAQDDDASAELHVNELFALWYARPNQHPRASWIVDLARVLQEFDRGDDLVAALQQVKRPMLWAQAAKALASGQPERGVELFQEIGSRTYEMVARTQAGEALAAEGRRAEADVHLRAAAAFWQSVGATRYLLETEALLAAAS
jgi:class 3 adenylate cyclase/tetratricopeptide (TPR) repeat protein